MNVPEKLQPEKKVVVSGMELITINPEQYVATLFEPFQTRLDAAVKKAKAIKYIITTKEGLEAAKAGRKMFKDLRIETEKARKERKAPIMQIGKLLDSRAEEITLLIEPHEERFDADIKAEEKRIEDEKAARIKAEAEAAHAIQVKMDEIKNSPLAALSASAPATKSMIEYIGSIEITEENFGERFVEAEFAQKVAIDQLTSMLAGKEAQEQLAAQQEAQRIENDRIAKQEAEARAAAEAKQREAQAAEAARLKAENEAIEKARAEFAKEKAAFEAEKAAEAAKVKAKEEAEARFKAQAEAEEKRVADAKAQAEAIAQTKANVAEIKEIQPRVSELAAQLTTIAPSTSGLVFITGSSTTNVPMVTIPKSEYERLLKDSEWLECLNAAGVDNWYGFDVAMDIFNGSAA